ncbi:hypothetical protein J2Z32_001572 [Paenibacillus turicensis]|uniref:Restriction endonuclease n=2 Tax=Paenibacillus TaxID=44249 RepID=A0A920CUM8_9BACL|nr:MULTISPECIES: hypothetical protein [Paenibacillus]MBP1904947.1 hypothetical protein [Paenibacillus turicensis]GIO49588.1 hypothetical protein J34TS1_43530 [Paenibacillus azoreducens]
MSLPYDREAELKERFNQFIANKITGSNEDYYSRMSVEDFEDIKTTLKDIHNIITYKTTIRFIDWVSERFPYVKENYQVYLEQVLKTRPNDNGYDLIVTGEVNIIAEIKCNKPINNGYKFGSAQRNGIVKDILGLLEGKSKVKSNPAAAFKFLVIYDFGDHTLSAAQHLIKNLQADLKEKVEIYEDSNLLTTDKVYVVFIK